MGGQRLLWGSDMPNVERNATYRQSLDYLRLIAEAFGGGPVGIETISAALGESRDAIEDVFEPFLLQQGFVQRTPRGRLLTGMAYGHLGLVAPPRDPAQMELLSRDDPKDD